MCKNTSAIWPMRAQLAAAQSCNMDAQRRAAQYIRMSRERQDLSPAIQRAAIESYARANGYDLVATYEDRGRSGLTIKSRPQMLQLIADVTSRDCKFEAILVYDVSRWGRFQDTDASAYYEYHCRMHHVSVVYVAEPFGSDYSPLTAVIKNLKRAMAAEYSRELGVKARAGQLRSISLGYEMGTLPCIGFRRIAEHKDGSACRLVGPRDSANILFERTRWIHGPAREVALVRKIFELYVQPKSSIDSVVRWLAQQGERSRTSRPITVMMVRSLLGCEAVIGNFVWGRKRCRSEARMAGNPRLVRIPDTVDPIVPVDLWRRVQQKLAQRRVDPRGPQQLLNELRSALQKCPRLTSIELAAYGCAGRKAYERHFGTLTRAFALAGRDAKQAYMSYIGKRGESQRYATQIARDISLLLESEGACCERLPYRATLRLSNGTTVRVQVVWLRSTGCGLSWLTAKYSKVDADYLLIARMREDGAVKDFFLTGRESYRRFPARTIDSDRPVGALWIDSHARLAAELQALGRALPLVG